MFKKKLKKANIGMMAFSIVVLIASSIIFLDTFEKHTLKIKAQNVENKLTSIDLSTYSAMRTGERDKHFSYTYTQINEFYNCMNQTTLTKIKNKFSDLEGRSQSVYGKELSEVQKDLLSLYGTSYLAPEKQYRCIYLDHDAALMALNDFMDKELGLEVGTYTEYSEEQCVRIYKPKSDNLKSPIAEIDVTEFFVRNAIPYWDADSKGNVSAYSRSYVPYLGVNKACNKDCAYAKDSQYTCIHMVFVVKLKTGTNLGNYDMFKQYGFAYRDTTDLVLHYDTLIDFSNVTQNNSQSS